MKKYAKLIDGALEYPILEKIVVDSDGNWLKTKKTTDEIKSESFKELIETLRHDDGKVYRVSYAENEDAISMVWEEIVPDPVPEPSYAQLRAAAYPETTEQLDNLYHDIDGGLFGDAAKTSAFYLARKGVKDAYPKVETADETAPSEQGETTK